MSIDKAQVQRCAALARLRLDDWAIDEYARQLTDIVDFFDALAAVDTDDTEPMSHPLDLVARLRDDVSEPVADPDTLQALSPRAESGLYRVPPVIES